MAAKKILCQLDYNKIANKNFVIENSSSITSPVKGQLYLDTDDNKLYYYNGTTMIECGPPSSIDASIIADGSVSNTEFEYLNGVTGAIQTQLGTKTTKYAANFGNASDTTYTITHNLGTKDVVVSIRINADDSIPDYAIVATSTNAITVSMEVAPGIDALRAIVIG